MRNSLIFISAFVPLVACHRSTQPVTVPAVEDRPTLARIYYWRAHPGKIDEYSRYIRDLAEPIDHEAQRHGAFISVTTTRAVDTTGAWTHVRVFKLRDSAQLAGLGKALHDAGIAVEPDSVKANARAAYSATLRDAAGSATVDLENGDLEGFPIPGFSGLPVREGLLHRDDDVPLVYRIVGAGGDTVVNVGAGAGTDVARAYDLEPLAAMGHATLAYEPSASGGPTPLSVDRQVAALDAILSHFHLVHAKLIGLSSGAEIAAQWAAQHPVATDRVIFVNPASPNDAFITARLRVMPTTTLMLTTEAGHHSWMNHADRFLRTIDTFLKANGG